MPDQQPFLAELVVLNEEPSAIATGLLLAFHLGHRLGNIVKAGLDSGADAVLGFPRA